MASYFDLAGDGGTDEQLEQSGRPGTVPSVPTLDTAYGTATGQANPNYTSGSPYFDSGAAPALFPNASFLGGSGNAQTPNPALTPTAISTTAPAPFDWTQFGGQFASLPTFDPSGGFSPISIASGTNQGYSANFTQPTGVDLTNDPGYQFRINQATQAQQASAAAHGTLLTGGTQKALTNAAQDQASAEYANVYNRALSTFTENANVGIANAQIANQQAAIVNSANEFNAGGQAAAYQNNIGNLYNYSALGLQSANAAASAMGATGTDLANVDIGYGNNLASLYGGVGNAQAAGSIAQGQIGANALTGLGNAANAALASTQK